MCFYKLYIPTLNKALYKQEFYQFIIMFYTYFSISILICPFKVHFHELLKLIVDSNKKSDDFYRKTIITVTLYIKKARSIEFAFERHI